jgi:hypothetical protein
VGSVLSRIGTAKLANVSKWVRALQRAQPAVCHSPCLGTSSGTQGGWAWEETQPQDEAPETMTQFWGCTCRYVPRPACQEPWLP